MELSGLWPVMIYYLIHILMNNLKIHTYAIDFQLEMVISQKVKPAALYRKKQLIPKKFIQ